MRYTAKRPTAPGSAHWVFHLDENSSTTEVSSKRSKEALVRTVAPSASNLNPDFRAHYAALLNYIKEVSSLSGDDDDFIDNHTRDSVAKLINKLGTSEAPPPTVFTHGGDAAVLVWKRPAWSLLITVSGAEAHFLTIDEKSGKRESVGYPLDDDRISNWLRSVATAGVQPAVGVFS